MAGQRELISISEVAAATGLRPSALRYYEQAGLISAAERRSGRRYFTRDVLDRLALISLCQDVGFTIAEIGHLVDGGRDARRRWQHLAEHKLSEIDMRIRRAETMRDLLRAALSCSCGKLADCELVAQAARRRLATRTDGPDE